MRWILTFVMFMFCFTSFSTETNPDHSPNKKRLLAVSGTNTLAWTGSILSLQYVWYQQFEKSKFHFFNDGHEWNQMDKMGHMYTAWQINNLVYQSYRWCGLNQKTSALIGTGISLGYLTTFEILDAFNAKWGFSWWDMAFNSLGAITYGSQAYLWGEQYVRFKFSYHNSQLSKYRPELLGKDFNSRLLKDYNGQTYWMSFNPFRWSQNESNVPEWINLSIGYSINNQLRGDGGTYVINHSNHNLTFEPYRQYYLSLDIDFEKIPTKSKFLKVLFKGINFIKVPFPAVEFSNNKLHFHPLYF